MANLRLLKKIFFLTLQGLLISALGLLASGCGQTGALFLPQEILHAPTWLPPF